MAALHASSSLAVLEGVVRTPVDSLGFRLLAGRHLRAVTCLKVAVTY